MPRRPVARLCCLLACLHLAVCPITAQQPPSRSSSQQQKELAHAALRSRFEQGADEDGLSPLSDGFSRWNLSCKEGQTPVQLFISPTETDVAVVSAIVAALGLQPAESPAQLLVDGAFGLRDSVTGAIFPPSGRVPDGSYTIVPSSFCHLATSPRGVTPGTQASGQTGVPAPVSAWGVEEVCAWAASVVGLDQEDLMLLRRHKVRGSSLLRLTKDDLVAMSLPRGVVVDLAAAVKSLRADRGAVTEPQVAKFNSDATYCVLLYFYYSIPSQDNGVFQLSDVNGDGLPDLVQLGNASDNRGPTVCVWLNPGA